MEAAGLLGKSAEEQSLETYWLGKHPRPLFGEQGTHWVESTVPMPVHWLTRTWEGLHARGEVTLQDMHLVVSVVELPGQEAAWYWPWRHLAHGMHLRESKVVVPSQLPKM